MNSDFFKNLTPSAFYFASVVSFVLASVLKASSLSFYYALLILGIGLFFVGAIKRARTKK